MPSNRGGGPPRTNENVPPPPPDPSTSSAKVTPTISVTVKRVAIDVVVKDAHGNPVTGLTRDDFRISEDGKPQTLRSFDAYAGSTQPDKPLDLPQLPPNTFSNFASVGQSGPPTVILYDLLNTPLDAQAYARAQLLKFLKQRRRSAPVAIFVLTDRLHMVQGFTDDDAALIAALDHQSGYKSTALLTSTDLASQAGTQAHPSGEVAPPPPTGPGGGQAQIGATPPQSQSDAEGAQISDMLNHANSLLNSDFLDQRVEVTAEALLEISNFLTGLPGRKNLLWFSASFPTGVLPTRDLTSINTRSNGNDGFLQDADVNSSTRVYSESIRKATNALNESHAAVYPVDVRGLQALPTYSAVGGTQTIDMTKIASTAAANQLNGQVNFATSQAAEHGTMDTIADETGGHAFYNTNGLAEAAQAAVSDGSTYYAMTYSPTNLKADARMRVIQVKCLKPGYTLEYRRNYFADGSPDKTAKQTPAPAVDEGKGDPMEIPLRHGAPPAHQLFFEVHVQPEGSPIPANSAEMVKLNEYQAANLAAQKKNKKKQSVALDLTKPVTMQHYLVAYGVLVRQLELPVGADGKRHGDLEFAVMAYDVDGVLLNGVRSTVSESVTPERYHHMQESGYQLVQRVGIPVNAATLRIGVRDGSTGHIGSTEVHLPLAPEVAAR